MPDYDLGTARGRIELDASSLGRASAAFAGLGRAMLGFGAVTVGAFVLVAKTAATFEKQMSAVQAVSGATAEQMVALKERALDLGSSTTYAAGEIGRAMEQLVKAGIDIDTVLGGATEATVALAAAAGDELAGGVDQAAVVMANALKTFNATADEAMHFADVLVGAAASSTLSVDDLATSMTYAGPTAAALGLSIDDLANALAILGDRGIRGSTAGTSLRGVLLGLTTQTPKAAKVMKRLGLITEDGTNRFFDMNGALKPLPDVLELLGDATADLSEQERLAAFNAIFQRRAMGAAMILAEQGAEGFSKYARAIAAIDAENVAATKLDNLSGDMTILKNSVNALIIQTGMQFQDMLRGWVQGLTDVVQWLRDVDPAIAGMVLKVGAIVGAVVGVLGAISLMVAAGIRMYRNFVLLAEGIGLVFKAIRLLTASLLLNPWFLLIAALVALGVILYKTYQSSEEFRNKVNAAFQSVKNFVLPIVETVRDGLRGLVEAFKGNGITSDGFVGFMERIGVVARDVFDFFRNEFVPGLVGFFDVLSGGAPTADGGFLGFMQQLAVSTLEVAGWIKDVGIPALLDFYRAAAGLGFDALIATVNFLVDEVFPRIAFVATETFERLQSAFNWVNDNVVPVFVSFGQLVAAVVERVISVIQFFGPVFQGVASVIKLALAAAWWAIQSFIDLVLNAWSLFGDNLWNAVLIAWDLIQGIVESALKIIQGIIQTITGIISGDWSKVWEGLGNILGGVWDGIKEIVTTAVDLIGLAIVTALDLINIAWDTAWEGMRLFLQVALASIITGLQTAWNTITGMFSNALGLLMSVWDSTFGALLGIATGALGNVLSFLGEQVGNIVGFFTGIPAKVLETMSTLGQQLYDFFFSAMNRAKNGVVIAATELWNYVKSIPGRILSGLGDLGMLLYEAGRKIIGGLIDGLLSMAGDLLDAGKGLFNDTIGRVIPGSPVEEGPLTVLNRGYAGAQIVKMLMDGIAGQMPALQSMLNRVMPTIDPTVNGAVTVPPIVAGAGSVDNSVHIGEVTIPVRDLQELKTVQDFFNRVGQVARQGVAI